MAEWTSTAVGARLVLMGAIMFLATDFATADAVVSQPSWLVKHEESVVAELKRVPLASDLRFVVGNEVRQPESGFKPGKDWLALVCELSACSLQRAELRPRPITWHGFRDELPKRGLQLNFRRAAPGTGRVIAWFAKNAQRRWLAAGAVPSYPFGPRLVSPGTFEVAVKTPDASGALLVPLLQQTQEHAVVYLQLRAAGVRQMLLGTLGDCSGTINRPYLLWSGDLDRDGRADYLVSFVDVEGPVHLYLSSEANPDALVGLAGVYDAVTQAGACDSNGWFVRR